MQLIEPGNEMNMVSIFVEEVCTDVHVSVCMYVRRKN